MSEAKLPYLYSLVGQRGMLAAMALAEANPNASLLKEPDENVPTVGLALLGYIRRGEEIYGCYDAEIASGFGLPPEKQKELHGVAFLQQAYLNLDSVFLACVHLLSMDAPPMKEISLKEREALNAELAEQFFSMALKAMTYGVDLPSILADAIALRTPTGDRKCL